MANNRKQRNARGKNPRATSRQVIISTEDRTINTGGIKMFIPKGTKRTITHRNY